MRRRLIAVLLMVLLGVGLASPAHAQFPTVAHGIAYATAASVSAANTLSSVRLFEYNVPAGLYATGSRSSVQGTVTLTNVVVAPASIHLRLLGSLQTNQGVGSVGNLNLGANFGGSTATIALVNARAPQHSLSAVPLQIDVWVQPIATATTGNTVWLTGRVTWGLESVGDADQNHGSAANATITTFNASVLGTTSLQNAVTNLVVNAQWGSASRTNSLNIYSGVVKIGE